MNKKLIYNKSCDNCAERIACIVKNGVFIMTCTRWKLDNDNFRAYPTNGEAILSMLNPENLYDFIIDPFNPDKFDWGSLLAEVDYDNIYEWLCLPYKE